MVRELKKILGPVDSSAKLQIESEVNGRNMLTFRLVHIILISNNEQR